MTFMINYFKYFQIYIIYKNRDVIDIWILAHFQFETHKEFMY